MAETAQVPESGGGWAPFVAAALMAPFVSFWLLFFGSESHLVDGLPAVFLDRRGILATSFLFNWLLTGAVFLAAYQAAVLLAGPRRAAVRRRLGLAILLWFIGMAGPCAWAQHLKLLP